MPRHTVRLNSEEKQFFSLVDHAVKANPFGQRRIDLDLNITGLSPGASINDRIEGVCREIEQRFRRLHMDIRQFKTVDQKILQSAVLFLFFHRYLEQFDAHIEEQVDKGNSPIKVRFALEGIQYLMDKGFDHTDAQHFFALSFQIRRAFYFIDRNIKGRCESMIGLKEALWNNLFTNSLEIYNAYLWNRMEDFSTLILGETGTGKGAVASAIGRSGYIPFDPEKKRFTESFNQSFVSLNLSQYSENLIESELFGHKKGAFTGAVNDRNGIFDQGSPHGAIFLDEIGEVTIPVQIKLLKVLEERTFFPVGGYEARRFKGRIIAATNRSIRDIKDKQVLRQDFFYRLCSDLIIMPPLRQRFNEDPGEMDELLAFTIQKILGIPSIELEKLVKGVIKKHPGKHYSWPGNVREFAQCVRRILLNHKYEGLKTQASDRPNTNFTQKMEKGELDSLSLLQGYCYALYEKTGTFGQVAKLTRLDWRTVKKYVQQWEKKQQKD